MNQYQTLDASLHGNVTIAALSFDPTSFDTLEVLGADMTDVVDSHQSQHLVVSFSHVSIICSDSIGILLRVRQTITSRGGQMHLCCMSPNIRQVFKLLNLDGTLFKIFDSQEDAVANLKSNELN